MIRQKCAHPPLDAAISGSRFAKEACIHVRMRASSDRAWPKMRASARGCAHLGNMINCKCAHRGAEARILKP
eukprot:12429563-Karenia_brevis.AAC.1